MYTVTIRISEDQFIATFSVHGGSDEVEGTGESITDALRDLAENIEAIQI